MTIYAAEFNPCIYESTFGIISIHRTKEGAEKAIEWHKHEKQKELDQMNEGEELEEDGSKPFKIQDWEVWHIREIELKD